MFDGKLADSWVGTTVFAVIFLAVVWWLVSITGPSCTDYGSPYDSPDYACE